MVLRQTAVIYNTVISPTAGVGLVWGWCGACVPKALILIELASYSTALGCLLLARIVAILIVPTTSD